MGEALTNALALLGFAWILLLPFRVGGRAVRRLVLWARLVPVLLFALRQEWRHWRSGVPERGGRRAG